MATLRELVTKLSFKADTKSVSAFEMMVKQVDKALDWLAKKSGKAEKGLDDVSKKARNAKKPLDDINSSAKTAGLGLGSLNLGLASAGLAFIAFSSNAVKSFGDLEHVFNTIRAVAPEVTPRMKEIEKSVMDLGASTTFSSLEVAKAYEELAKKGFTAQQMLETMPGLLDASMASGENLAQVADIVTSSIQQFNLKTSQSGEVADLLTQGANTSSASILSLGDGLIYAGANGRAYNQTLKEMITSLAVLNNAGVKAGDAGSDIAALLANFNAIAVGHTKKQIELRHTIKKLGVTIIDSKGKMLPFLDIIQSLGKATRKWTDAKRNGLALDIAGKENQKTLNLIMGMSKEKIDAVRKSMDASAGSSKKASAIMKEGLNPTLERLGGATDAFNVSVGKMFSPAVIQGLELLTKTMEGLGNAVDWMDSQAKNSQNQMQLGFLENRKKDIAYYRKIGLSDDKIAVMLNLREEGGFSKLPKATSKNLLGVSSTEVAKMKLTQSGNTSNSSNATKIDFIQNINIGNNGAGLSSPKETASTVKTATVQGIDKALKVQGAKR